MLKKFIKFVTARKIHTTILAGAAIACCGVTGIAQALPFNKISHVYFFGDSLTDSGFNNLFPGRLPTKAPTFTTLGGYIWSQYVAHDIKGFPLPTFPPGVPDTITNNTTPLNGPGFVLPILTGVDYAAGGSTTNSTGNPPLTYAPSLIQQVTHFLITTGTKPQPSAVYFIWSGANDILITAGTAPTQENLIKTADRATTNIVNAARMLSDSGAKRIVVLSLPNIGITPAIAATGPKNQSALQAVTFIFNSLLNQKLGILKKTHPTLKVLIIDTYLLLDNVIAAIKAGKSIVVGGQTFKFTNFKDEACGGPPSIVCTTAGPAGYVFADGLHPTNMAHRLLSLQVETEILNWK